MKQIGKLTDNQYDFLIGCFKCKMSREIIALLSGISYARVCKEWERWHLCCAISKLQPPEKKLSWNERHLSNSSKIFSY